MMPLSAIAGTNREEARSIEMGNAGDESFVAFDVGEFDVGGNVPVLDLRRAE